VRIAGSSVVHAFRPGARAGERAFGLSSASLTLVFS